MQCRFRDDYTEKTIQDINVGASDTLLEALRLIDGMTRGVPPKPDD